MSKSKNITSADGHMGLSGIWRAASFAVLVLVPTLFELALAERKFGILRGGFGASQVVDGWREWMVFSITLLFAQIIAAALIWRFVVFLHQRRWNGRLFIFGIVGLTTGITLALISARYELLRYFSDALGFELIRNLGGGSLTDAALYVLEGSGLVLLLAGAGAVLTYLIARYILQRDVPASHGRWKTPKFAKIGILLAALFLPIFLMIGDGIGDVRFALQRFPTVSTARSILANATDFDRDGFGYFSMLRDPAPFDVARYPMAMDIPDNGIDEDGYGGDLTAVSPRRPVSTLALNEKPMNVIVIIVESLRGDVLGKKVDGKIVAPHMEAIAARGTATRAYSHVGFTTASLKSLFTGELAPVDDRHSLFPILKKAEYKIGVFSGQPEDFGRISSTTGMRRSADVYVDAEVLKDERAGAFAAQGSLLVDEERLLKAFDESFGAKDAWKKPTFLYFNFQSPHFPYWHPKMENLLESDPLPRSEITPENRQRLERTYWNAVAWADHNIGLLVERLEKLGQLENSLIVISGDHGESLFDDGFLGHGHAIGKSQTETALIISHPVLKGAGDIGLYDYRNIIIDALSGRETILRQMPVFQHIGDIESPTRIGMVSQNKWVTFDPQTGSVWFDDRGPETKLSKLSTAKRRQVGVLQNLWASRRWQHHQRARNMPEAKLQD